MPISRKSVVVDTGFWFALFNEGNGERFNIAREKAAHLESLIVIVPWPILYETVNTRFVKNQNAVVAFERRLKQSNVTILDDTKYRQPALEASLQSMRVAKRPLALCDMVTRLIMEDVNVRVNALLTFDPRHFVDVCRNRRIQLL